MANLQRLKRVAQFGRKVYDALMAPGTYIPQQTTTNAAGETVVTQEEIVQPQGALRSNTIRLAITGVTGSVTGIIAMVNGSVAFDLTVFLAFVGTLATSAGTIWTHVRSWMPLIGMGAPVPMIEGTATRTPPPIVNR